MATIALSPDLRLPPEAIADFCRRWGIVRLELFGSALRGDFGPDSDLDFLFLLGPDVHVGWKFAAMCDELEQLVGRKVDLISRSTIELSSNLRRRREILESARVIYAA